MIHYAWVVAALPAVACVLIFTVGKRMPGKGAEIGIVAVAAAEVGIGLAIVLLIFRNRETVNIDEVDLLRW